MQNELDIVRDVSARLERAGIAYMLTGSMAMNYYAKPRMTRDIDIVVALEPGAAGTIFREFSPDYYVPRDAVSSAIENRGMFNLLHQESIIKVDCIVKKNAAYRYEEFDRRILVAIEEFSTWIVSKEDLIISKLDWARDSRSELQMGDVRNLLSTGYDEDYVARWTQELGLTDLLEECRR